MAKRLTVKGITVHADIEAANDYRILTALASSDDNRRVEAFDNLLRAVLGKDYDKALDALQGDKAYLAPEDVREFADELMQKANALKN